MNIALVFPRSIFLIDPMVYPPLGLWYLAAQIEALGHDCDFFDLSVDKLPNDGDYDQLWLSATSAQMHEVRVIASQIQWWTKTKTILGGAAPWSGIFGVERLGFSLVVAGEGDHPHTIEHILSAEKSLTVYRPSITPGELNWVLPPVRRWDNKYHSYLADRNGFKHKTSTLFTSRGCPMSCTICESGRSGIIWDKFVRYEPVELVEKQMQDIVETGHTGIMYYDDIFPLNKERMLKILKLHRKYKLIYRCFLRTDVIIKQGGFEYLREMARSGLIEVLAGVESADNQIKDNIHKGTTIEQDTMVLNWCKQLGIKFKASIILGLPGETRETLETTRRWILANRPDRVDINTLIPFPGTPITRAPKGTYDVYWTEQFPEEYWFKGPRNDTQALVGTSHLEPAEIKEFHKQLMAEIEKEGIPY
jgi:anaerobic magnesium-protoporphyrin IX monomethyl ester cyclase